MNHTLAPNVALDGVSASALYNAVALSIKCICLRNVSIFLVHSLSGSAFSRAGTHGEHQLLSPGVRDNPPKGSLGSGRGGGEEEK